jgi:putative ABC transport system permease protein
VTTFQRLSNRPTGFSAERVLVLDTIARPAQLPVYWDQVKEKLKAVPGVETVAMAGWPLMSGTMSNNFVSINGAPPAPVLTLFLKISPGWIGAMKIPLIDGRDFRLGDTNPGVAIVNEAFSRQYFLGQNPVGKWFETAPSGVRTRFEIVGLVGDVVYQNVREPIPPQAYVPFSSINPKGIFQPIDKETIIVRTLSSNPLAIAPTLRRAIPVARPGFRVSDIRTQQQIDDAQTVRERLLESLAVFFGGVALLLAGIGLYEVLNYTVLQRRREIGIRMALGARTFDVTQYVTFEVLTTLLAGSVAGLTVGLASVHYIQSLLYQVKATDPAMLAVPSVATLVVAVLAAMPPVIRAIGVDPATTLRME